MTSLAIVLALLACAALAVLCAVEAYQSHRAAVAERRRADERRAAVDAVLRAAGRYLAR
jgi:hypothetical protein